MAENKRCRAFRFYLRPTAAQIESLTLLLDLQREVYNAALEERRGAWKWERRSVSLFGQQRQIADLNLLRPELKRFGTRPTRGTLARLDLAFEAFYRRCRQGGKPGFPRFQGKSRFDSVSWSDTNGWKLVEPDQRLYLQGVGRIKATLHRPVRGTQKTITVRREGHRWFVTVFCVDVPAEPLPATGRMVGLDLGVAALVTTSDGEQVINERFERRGAEKAARLSRSLALKKRGSARCRKAVERLAAEKRKQARQRRDHAHKLSRRLVNENDVIVHEDLRITDMIRRPKPIPNGEGGFAPNGAAAKGGLNRSIFDAGWGILLAMIAYKAEEAGRAVVAVDPRYTSQTCHQCGHADKGNRVTQAEFGCLRCGHSANADVNAAKNILRAGLAQLREKSEVA